MRERLFLDRLSLLFFVVCQTTFSGPGDVENHLQVQKFKYFQHFWGEVTKFQVGTDTFGCFEKSDDATDGTTVYKFNVMKVEKHPAIFII